MKFECHITIENQFSSAESAGRYYDFHFSQIDGDEKLGPGVKGYLTKSSEHLEDLIEDMNKMTGYLTFVGIRWTRKKIEAIILDDRHLY